MLLSVDIGVQSSVHEISSIPSGGGGFTQAEVKKDASLQNSLLHFPA